MKPNRHMKGKPCHGSVRFQRRFLFAPLLHTTTKVPSPALPGKGTEMGVNVEKEYRQFEQEMEWYRKEYLAAGLPEGDFRPLYEFCKAQLARDIAYQKHSQSLCVCDDYDEEERNPLIQLFPEQLTYEDSSPKISKYWWIDELSNGTLAKRLLSLSDLDLQIIDLYVFQGLNQEEASKVLGKNQVWISRKIASITKKLKEVQKK